MMELIDDVDIKCEKCQNVITRTKAELDKRIDIIDHGKQIDGHEVFYTVDDFFKCPCCGNEILLHIGNAENPPGTGKPENTEYSCIGGKIKEAPILYIVLEDYAPGNVAQRWIILIADNWDWVYFMSSRDFELIVEEMFKAEGYYTKLTPAIKDGGKDIIAIQYGFGRPIVTYVECKKYGQDKTVGVGWVRKCVGIQAKDRVNKIMLVTTARFTKGAKEEASEIKTLMDLIDGEELKQRIGELAERYKKTVEASE